MKYNFDFIDGDKIEIFSKNPFEIRVYDDNNNIIDRYYISRGAQLVPKCYTEYEYFNLGISDKTVLFKHGNLYLDYNEFKHRVVAKSNKTDVISGDNINTVEKVSTDNEVADIKDSTDNITENSKDGQGTTKQLERQLLLQEAEKLGLKITPNMKNETIERKINNHKL